MSKFTFNTIHIVQSCYCIDIHKVNHATGRKASFNSKDIHGASYYKYSLYKQVHKIDLIFVDTNTISYLVFFCLYIVISILFYFSRTKLEKFCLIIFFYLCIRHIHKKARNISVQTSSIISVFCSYLEYTINKTKKR